MTKKERNSEEQLNSFVNASLLSNSRVSFQKFDRKTMKRGLDQGETPFPAQPKIGPYVVSFSKF
jgi:hypothetical protein